MTGLVDAMLTWQNAAGFVVGLLLGHFAIVFLKRHRRRRDAVDLAWFREWQQRQADRPRGGYTSPKAPVADLPKVPTGPAPGSPAKVWDDGYREACGHHGGYDSCAVRDHGQHRINPYRTPPGDPLKAWGVTAHEMAEYIRSGAKGVGVSLADLDPDPCDHVATLTAPIHAAIGPWIHTTTPVTICVTCHAEVNLEETR